MRRAALIAVVAALACMAGASAEAPSPSAVVRLEAGGRACHTQGVTIAGEWLFASCVDVLRARAMIYRFPLPAGFPAQAAELSAPVVKDITAGPMYHPSGLDHDDRCVWVAVAHYRKDRARAKVMCLDPATLEERSSFMAEDHLGAIAVMGETLVGWNWDAREIYRFSKEGALLGKSPSPEAVAYQDCKGAGGQVLCSGPFTAPGDKPPPAAVDRLSYDPASSLWSSAREAVIAYPEVSLGREGFCPWNQSWLFLPEDFPRARLFVYPRPQ